MPQQLSLSIEQFQENFSQVCIDVTETECSTTTSTECHDYEDVDCEIEAKEICIKADATTCVDTEFAASSAIGAGSGDGEQCRSIDTQRCSQPIPEQVCANINQVGGRRLFSV